MFYIDEASGVKNDTMKDFQACKTIIKKTPVIIDFGCSVLESIK
jgi:hypothetical protein